ncbi:hypothetical protein ACH5RR_008405 [Cinchona calisaya]|uniref:Uncharacterized protein n=1 Tax=Cinchona calisaya TaxID=153742 RepID=A0ABD3AH60_9GENT
MYLILITRLIGKPLQIDTSIASRIGPNLTRVCVEVDLNKRLPFRFGLDMILQVSGKQLHVRMSLRKISCTSTDVVRNEKHKSNEAKKYRFIKIGICTVAARVNPEEGS